MHVQSSRRYPASVQKLILLCASVLALLGLGCQGEVDVAEPNDQPQVVSLPDGTRLAIPSGARYFYTHIEVTGPITSGPLQNSVGHENLVVSRIDWSLCNPRAASVRFYSTTGSPINEATWRIPTLITTPLAGINILGIFAGGGTLEGGLRVDLNNGGVTDPGASNWRVHDGCAGDWVSMYGYTQ